MKHVENKKISFSLTDVQLPVFWLRSLRFSTFDFVDPKKDYQDLKLTAEIFLKLRDFGITGILFVFIYDFVKILKHKEYGSFSRFYDSKNSVKFWNYAASESYKCDCINVFKTSQEYKKLRILFNLENTDIHKFAIFFEQLFENLNKYLSFYFFAPEYDLSGFDADLTQVFDSIENNKSNIVQASVGFSESLEGIFHETVEFLKNRLTPNSEIEQYQPIPDKLNEIRNAHLFIKKSVRTQKRLIEKISRNLQPLNLEEITSIEQTQDFVEADDAFYYPRGGNNELTRKGNIETILPSELVFIDEKIDKTVNSPDLFTLRYAENEILYFQRDDGYIKRKHYVINLVLWDFLCFRTMIPKHEHTFDVYLESALHRFIQDFIKFTDGKGLKLSIFWLYKKNQQTVETPELFKQIFNNYEKLGIIENYVIEDISSFENQVKSSTKHESWFFFLPAIIEHPQFQNFEDFYTKTSDKTKFHIIKFETDSKLPDIVKINDNANLYKLKIPSANEDKESLKLFENLVHLLFKTLI